MSRFIQLRDLPEKVDDGFDSSENEVTSRTPDDTGPQNLTSMAPLDDDHGHRVDSLIPRHALRSAAVESDGSPILGGLSSRNSTSPEPDSVAARDSEEVDSLLAEPQALVSPSHGEGGQISRATDSFDQMHIAQTSSPELPPPIESTLAEAPTASMKPSGSATPYLASVNAAADPRAEERRDSLVGPRTVRRPRELHWKPNLSPFASVMALKPSQGPGASSGASVSVSGSQKPKKAPEDVKDTSSSSQSSPSTDLNDSLPHPSRVKREATMSPLHPARSPAEDDTETEAKTLSISTETSFPLGKATFTPEPQILPRSPMPTLLYPVIDLTLDSDPDSEVSVPKETITDTQAELDSAVKASSRSLKKCVPL
jgi:hypothetical protein